MQTLPSQALMVRFSHPPFGLKWRASSIGNAAPEAFNELLYCKNQCRGWCWFDPLCEQVLFGEYCIGRHGHVIEHR